jgi:hypothetical protein
MHEDIGAAGEATHNFLPARIVQVGAYALFVAIAAKMDRRIAMPQWCEAAAIIAALRPLDLDHVGAEITEQLRTIRTGQILRQVGND